MPTVEFRAGIELRAIGGRKLAGYALTFGTVAQITSMGRKFSERVMQGAFSASLKRNGDVPALVDHDASRLLARTGSGTLRLAEDTRGLQFELDLPDTNLGRDMQVMAERGDLAGMSIGFQVAPGGEAWSDNLRELRAIELIEVSIAQCWPAYPDTTIALLHRQQPANLPLDPAARRRMLDLL
jgi:uncharacterized protein